MLRTHQKTLIGLVVCVACVLAFGWWRSTQVEEVEPYPNDRILRAAAIEGIQHRLTDDGNLSCAR